MMIISFEWKMEAKRNVPDNFWHTSNWIDWTASDTLQGTNISPQNGILKMIFLFPRWDMLIPWRVFMFMWSKKYLSKGFGLAESKPRRSLVSHKWFKWVPFFWGWKSLAFLVVQFYEQFIFHVRNLKHVSWNRTFKARLCSTWNLT